MTKTTRINFNILGIILIFLIVCMFQLPVVAKSSVYQVLPDESGAIQVTENDVVLRNIYITLQKSNGSYHVVKPLTGGSYLYYIDAAGNAALSANDGYVKISYKGKKNSYYSKNGKLLTNQIVGNKKAGYRYVDSTGIVIKDAVVQDAVNFVVKHSDASASNDKRLRSCYQYLWKHYKYQRFYGGLSPKAKDMRSYAKYMFKYKKGNCHRYAACFAYIARVLGYDSKVVVGSISSNRGGMTPHGWSLVKKGKSWLVCDPDMELNGVHDYMVARSSCRTSITRKCTLTIKNGVVKWK